MADKVTIGWLEDKVGFVGGAELSGAALRENAPDWVEIIPCPSRKRPPTERIDLFVIQNCTQYAARWVEELALKPVVKQIRDPWYSSDCLFRRWLLENSELLLFSSPLQVHAFEYETDLPYKILPPPLDLEPFRKAALPEEDRVGNVFVGRCDVFKGAHAVVDWAVRNGEKLDMYGHTGFLDFGKVPSNITFHGQVPYRRMPFIFGKAKRFVAFPTWPEAFGRTAAEAWAAGCKLLLREGRVGAEWWIRNRPEDLEKGAEMFWEAIGEVVS